MRIVGASDDDCFRELVLMVGECQPNLKEHNEDNKCDADDLLPPWFRDVGPKLRLILLLLHEGYYR